MTLQDLILYFRRQVSDEASPPLWSDDEILRYAISAQDEFVRRVGGIADASTAAIVELALVDGQPFTAHSPYILRIRSGRLVTAKQDITFVNEADLANLRISDYGSTIGVTLDDTVEGPVHYGILGIEDNKVRWLDVPAANDTCKLHVLRLPYPRITDQTGTLEVGEQHHIHLVQWMKFLAYSKEDAETYDKTLADAGKAQFEEYCNRAREETARKRYKPRVVQYGGL